METSTRKLVTVLGLVGAVNDRFTLSCSTKGWTLGTISPERICMCTVRMDGALFTGTPVTGLYGVDLDRLAKTLKNMGDTVDVDIFNGRIHLSSDGMELSVPHPVESGPEPSDKDLVFDSEGLVRVDVLLPLLKAGKALEDQYSRTGDSVYVTVEMEPDRAVFSVMGNDWDDRITKTVPKEGFVAYEGAGSRSTYPFSYVSDILGAVPKGSMVGIGCSTDWPVHISWGEDGVTSDWLIAPRIESDDL